MTAMPGRQQPALVVLSHLRWPWVWQRPQHLVSRLAQRRAAAGARTYFVEEPLPANVAQPQLELAETDGIVQVVLKVPQVPGQEHLGFADPAGADYGRRLAALLAQHGVTAPDVWLYTPMAMPLAESLRPGLLVYDVMDDLASFAGAPAGLRAAQRRLLDRADVVFTGGRSLHHSTTALRRTGVHLFASGVETGHYAPARTRRSRRTSSRVAGYIGVIDERIDLALVAELAAALPEWTIRMVGPVTKIDEADLPRAANLDYPGMVDYAALPDVLAGFDVALMPFALNEATRRISPTKTLEYFAAGLPVVSTRIPDVVLDYGDAVQLADTGAQFAECCRRASALTGSGLAQIDDLLGRREWDYIAAAMVDLIEDARCPSAERLAEVRR